MLGFGKAAVSLRRRDRTAKATVDTTDSVDEYAAQMEFDRLALTRRAAELATCIGRRPLVKEDEFVEAHREITHRCAAGDPGNLSISLPGGRETNERTTVRPSQGSPQ